MIFGSVCSGIEAASVAWHPLGWRAAFVADIDPFASAVLAHRCPDVPNLGDFTRIGDEHAGIDLLVGGTPCQSFSVAGRRLGLDDPRGDLTLEFCALARRLRPCWFVWENVPGVLSLDGGRTFAAVLGAMVECGYGLAWRVLDAQFVRVDGFARAVAQRRQRVFVVGHLGDARPARAVLLEPEGMQGHPPPRREAGACAAAPLASGSERGSGYRNDADTAENLVAFDETQITSAYNRSRPEPGGPCHTLSAAARPPAIAFGGNDTRGAIEVATARTAHAGGSGRLDFESETFLVAPDVAASLTHGVDSRGAGGYAGRRQEDDVNIVASTLTAQHRGGGATAGNSPGLVNPIVTPYGVRRLTPRECERLQGFPDDWTLVPYRGKPAADGPRYRAIGNSMAVNVMRWIGMRIDLFERARAAA